MRFVLIPYEDVSKYCTGCKKYIHMKRGGGITYYINQRKFFMRPFLLYMSYNLFDEYERANIRHTQSCQLTFSEVLRSTF